VLEGSWQHFCGENSPRGCSKCKPVSCPDATGQQANCSINFVDNWLFKSTFVQHEQCSRAGAHVSGTVNVTGDTLPPEALAIVAAAGPRVW